MRIQYNEWMTSEMHELTRTGKIRKPSYSTLAKWVKQAWDDVDVNLIIKSFRCCGISLDQSGKDDDEWLFNYERLHENNEGGRYNENDAIDIHSDNENTEPSESTGQLQIDNIDEDMLENYENDW